MVRPQDADGMENSIDLNQAPTEKYDFGSHYLRRKFFLSVCICYMYVMYH